MGRGSEETIFSKLLFAIISGILLVVAIYYFYPPMVNLSATDSSKDFCQLKDETEIYGLYFYDDKPKLEAFFDNNSEGFVRVESINIKTLGYEAISESDINLRTDIGGHGDVSKTIYLKSKVGPNVGDEYKCEFDYELGNYSSYDYIELSEKSSDKYFITLTPNQSGKYDVKIEIEYKYHGKRRVITTNTISFIYIDKTRFDFQPWDYIF